MSQQVAIVDYGMGNVRSVLNAFQAVSAPNDQVFLSNDPERLRAADRIVFPGQGAAGDCMAALRQDELDQVIAELATNKPFLGICMGMQVLLGHSDENNGTTCMNYFPGGVHHFVDNAEQLSGLKIPHMGWNSVAQTSTHPLWHNIPDHSMFYFVHSYYVAPEQPELTVGETSYGIDFTAALAADNIFAIQCHPEKSSTAGLQLLSNFLEWDGS